RTFAADLAAKGIPASGPPDLWLAELALGAAMPAHWMFALETLFETASSDQDFFRLRDATGSADLFGLQARSERDQMREQLHQARLARDNEVALRDAAIAERDRTIAALVSDIGQRDRTLAALGSDIGQ